MGFHLLGQPSDKTTPPPGAASISSCGFNYDMQSMLNMISGYRLALPGISQHYPIWFKARFFIFCLWDPSHWLWVLIPSNLLHKSSQTVEYESANGSRLSKLVFLWYLIISSHCTSLFAAKCPPAFFVSAKNTCPFCLACPFMIWLNYIDLWVPGGLPYSCFFVFYSWL